MCNKSLFAIGFNSVRALFCNVTTCSARDRIICLGDLCQDIGLPDSILPEDLANVSRSLGNIYIGSPTIQQYNDYLAQNTNDESTYASFAEGTFQRLGAFLHLDIYFWLNTLGPNNYQYSLEWRDALEDVINLEYPSELDWILCNLTKRVYVTARAITERTGIQPRGPFFNAPINLTEILMFKICCSTDPSCSMTYPSPLHQGPWAADRFEITTMDWLDQLEVVKGRVEKDWEDVSEEAVKEIVEIVKSEYPSRWEQMITNPIKIEGVRDTAENLVG